MKQWIAAIIAVEAVVEIIVTSDIFIAFRAWVTRVNPGFFGKLFSCGYCMSVWIAGVAAFCFHSDLVGDPWIDWALRWQIVHRVSNAHHELLSRYFKRLPLVVVFNFVKNPGFEEPEDTVVEVPDKKPEDQVDGSSAVR